MMLKDQNDSSRTPKNWYQRLWSGERRHAVRQRSLPLVAYYWDGDVPLAHKIYDISSTGLYLHTDQRWYPGTVLMLSIQKTDVRQTDLNTSLTVQAKVVRADANGVGFALLVPPARNRRASEMHSSWADQKALKHFLEGCRQSSGQALIEYLLMIPLIFILIVNIVNFGAFFFAWITVANAARAGADYAILGGVSVGALRQASATQVAALITQDVSSLPNASSVAVNVCQSYNGTVTVVSGTCTAIPADAEPSTFALMSIDVTYKYQPLIPAGFQFPNLHLYATIPPTTVHRRAVMRIIQ